MWLCLAEPPPAEVLWQELGQQGRAVPGNEGRGGGNWGVASSLHSGEYSGAFTLLKRGDIILLKFSKGHRVRIERRGREAAVAVRRGLQSCK